MAKTGSKTVVLIEVVKETAKAVQVQLGMDVLGCPSGIMVWLPRSITSFLGDGKVVIPAWKVAEIERGMFANSKLMTL